MAIPIEYSDKMVDTLCDLISTSEFGLRRIVKDNPGLPAVSTIMKWLADGNHPYLVEQYARAKELQADYIVDQAFEIADDNSNDTLSTEKGDFENKEWVNRSRLRVDLRKWKAARLAPKKYGDNIRLDAEINQTITLPHGTIKHEPVDTDPSDPA